MKKINILFAGLLLAAAAQAQPPGGGGMPSNEVIFANNDGNGDGEITRAEADAAGVALSQNWDMFDLNSDGKVVAEELDAMRGRVGGPGRAGGAGAAGARGAGPAAEEDAETGDDN